MSDLFDCYSKIKPILGDSVEQFESVALIERYREYWKPREVKVVLLAESHVYTTAEDRQARLPVFDSLPGYPREYAKFVYCLGYGERKLTRNHIHPDKGGTPQFWKIFYSCMHSIRCNADFAPVQGKTPFLDRLKNKIKLLKQMRDSGVWLVDASIVALYNGGQKPSGDQMEAAIMTSWKGFIRQKIKEAAPTYVICVGKGVGNILSAELKALMGENFEVIAQPNAHLSAEKHLQNFQRYGEVCRNYCK